MNAPFKNWGWINWLTDLERVVFHAERLRHDKEMADGTGEHHAKYVSEGHATEFECSCGFDYKMDSSG